MYNNVIINLSHLVGSPILPEDTGTASKEPTHPLRQQDLPEIRAVWVAIVRAMALCPVLHISGLPLLVLVPGSSKTRRLSLPDR